MLDTASSAAAGEVAQQANIDVRFTDDWKEMSERTRRVQRLYERPD